MLRTGLLYSMAAIAVLVTALNTWAAWSKSDTYSTYLVEPNVKGLTCIAVETGRKLALSCVPSEWIHQQ